MSSIPNGAQIESAELRLFCIEDQFSGGASFCPLVNSWSESGVTWNNLNGQIQGGCWINDVFEGWVTLDFTEATENWFDGTWNNNGLVIYGSTTQGIAGFWSSESAVNRPRLIVCYEMCVPEICNGMDDDCDGQTDEGNIGPTWYRDQDGDGYGTPNNTLQRCSQPSGYVNNDDDCNDSNSNIPGQEVCNGTDDDCDGQIDEGNIGSTWYRDQDGDGYGNPSNTTTSCSQPAGYVSNDDDCNDNCLSCKPGAIEVCDNLDNDCDGQTDEGDACNTWCRDADNDTYGDPNDMRIEPSAPSGYVGKCSDCDDDDANINPGMSDPCNGINDDCGAMLDETCEVGACCDESNSCSELTQTDCVNAGRTFFGIGTECSQDICTDPDIDDDGVPNDSDNCRVTPNENQLDSDNDGIGDACDPSIPQPTCPDGSQNCAEFLCNSGPCGNFSNWIGQFVTIRAVAADCHLFVRWEGVQDSSVDPTANPIGIQITPGMNLRAVIEEITPRPDECCTDSACGTDCMCGNGLLAMMLSPLMIVHLKRRNRKRATWRGGGDDV